MSEMLSDNSSTEPIFVISPSCKSKSNSLAQCSNAMGNALKQIKENRRLRHNKFPSLKGSYYGCDILIGNVDINSDYYYKRNYGAQPMAPHRIYDSLVDPTSGFLSVGCDDGHSKINPVVSLNNTPQSMTPESQYERYNSLLEAPFQLKRQSTWCPGCPTAWNSRKASDVWVRAKIGGWTNDVDTKRVKDIKRLSQKALMREQAQDIQDKLALKFIYGTSTQRGYEDVPWDSILRPKQHPPTMTDEERSDIVLYHRNKKLCNPTIQECQAVDYSSGHFLPTDGPATLSYLGNQVQQWPLFSGIVGAKRCSEADKFEPYSMRTSSAFQPRQEAQEFPSGRPHSDYTRKSRMSKMVTLVPPYNPFNTMEKVPVLV